MPRLFTGIEIPADLRTRLSLLSAPLFGAKWVSHEDLHLTLRFLGDIDGRTADEFVDGIETSVLPPFEMGLTQIGHFGSQRPDLLWVGAEPKETLARLNRWHERAARAAGLEPDSRPFVPHVTLARLRGTRPEEVASYIQGLGKLALPSFRVSRIAIFSARPGTGGGPYAVEAIIPLDATDDEEWA